MRGLVQILQEFLALLPPWAAALVVLGGLALVAPGLRSALRSRQIRESVRRMVRASPDLKAQLVERAFDRAGTSAPLVALLATESHRRQLPAVHTRALERLAELPHGRVELARLRRALAPERPAREHPLQTAVRVDLLLSAGAVAAARARLEEGLGHHPEHAELLALRSKVEAAEAALDEADPER